MGNLNMRTILAVVMGVAAYGASQAQTTDELKALPDAIWTGVKSGFGSTNDTINDCGNGPCYSVAISLGAGVNMTGQHNIVLGAGAGNILEDGKDNILVGVCTAAPTPHSAAPTPHSSGFVNIANKLCFWRTTGERVACPPPEPECKGGK
jgi:hypothetical protein